MTAFTKTIVSTLIVTLAFACIFNSGKEIADFSNMPDSTAKRCLDSLAWVIDKSIPLKEKGFPTNQKGRSYFEERPYFDSSHNLKKVTVYEFQSDSFISYTDYHYWHGRFIKMHNDVAGSEKMVGIAYYIFKNERLIDSSVVLLKPISADTLIRRAEDLRKRFEKL